MMVPVEPHEFVVANAGIKVLGVCLVESHENGVAGYILSLDCSVHGILLGIYLRQVGCVEFLREDPLSLFLFEKPTPWWGAPPMERVLLTALPEDLFYTTTMIGHKNHILSSKRTSIFQIERLPSMTHVFPWPASSYDREDQLFVTYGNLARDFGILEVHLSISPSRSQHHHLASLPDTLLHFGFCVIGWSSKDPSQVQFGIFPWTEHAIAMTMVKTELSSSDRDGRWLGYYMDVNGVYKSLAAACNTAVGQVVHITFKATLKEDITLFKHSFWNVSFEYEVFDHDSAPAIAI